MSETVPIKEHNHPFVLYDADGCLVGKANPGKKVMLADAFYVPERTCRNLDVRMDRGFECSSCGYEAETYGDSLCNPDDFEFCPMCGARVEVDELVDTLLNICNTPGHDVIQRPQPSVDRNQLPSDCGSRKELKALSAFSVVQSEKDISGTTVRQYDFFDGSKKACSVQTFDWWDGKNVAGLEVSEEYKGRGLSYSLLDYAVNELNVVNLAVEKSNSIAMHVYEKYGFVRVDEDESYVYMSVERGVKS